MVRARKRFGQHFLDDEGVLLDIVSAMRPLASDHVLEIGPGQGALTALIWDQVERFLAVEIDRDLVPVLERRFPGIEVRNEDILTSDVGDVLHSGSWRLLGNLPYNISSPLIAKLSTWVRAAPNVIVDGHFMLQREMAARLSAVPGTKAWGRLSVATQAMFEVQPLFDVPPESFSPPPKVWSSVIRMRPKPVAELPSDADMEALDHVLRVAFSNRRKRLDNALRNLTIDWDAAGVDPGDRADNVDLGGYLALARQHQEAASTRP